MTTNWLFRVMTHLRVRSNRRLIMETNVFTYSWPSSKRGRLFSVSPHSAVHNQTERHRNNARHVISLHARRTQVIFISTLHLFCTEARNTLNLVICVTENFMEQNPAHKNDAVIFVLFIVRTCSKKRTISNVEFATF